MASIEEQLEQHSANIKALGAVIAQADARLKGIQTHVDGLVGRGAQEVLKGLEGAGAKLQAEQEAILRQAFDGVAKEFTSAIRQVSLEAHEGLLGSFQEVSKEMEGQLDIFRDFVEVVHQGKVGAEAIRGELDGIKGEVAAHGLQVGEAIKAANVAVVEELSAIRSRANALLPSWWGLLTSIHGVTLLLLGAVLSCGASFMLGSFLSEERGRREMAKEIVNGATSSGVYYEIDKNEFIGPTELERPIVKTGDGRFAYAQRTPDGVWIYNGVKRERLLRTRMRFPDGQVTVK